MGLNFVAVQPLLLNCTSREGHRARPFPLLGAMLVHQLCSSICLFLTASTEPILLVRYPVYSALVQYIGNARL